MKATFSILCTRTHTYICMVLKHAEWTVVFVTTVTTIPAVCGYSSDGEMLASSLFSPRGNGTKYSDTEEDDGGDNYDIWALCYSQCICGLPCLYITSLPVRCLRTLPVISRTATCFPHHPTCHHCTAALPDGVVDGHVWYAVNVVWRLPWL